MRMAFGVYELDTELFELRCDGEPRQIEPQVFDLLLYLVRHRDRIVSRRELLDELWAGKVVADSTLNSRIKAVRQAVGDTGQSQRCIATFNRRGYRFVAEVQEQVEEIGGEAEVEMLDGALLTGGILAGSEDAGGACLFPRPPALHPDRPSLAVLPFAHSPGNENVAWIADVVGEDISIQLARIPGFLVVSRNSTAQYRGRELSIRQIGQELDADYLVEGSVWETGNRLRVSVQLLETVSDRLLWADRKEIPRDRLDELQEDVVREVVGCIEPELNRAELATLRKRRPVDLGAWALYRQGHAILGLKGWSEESFSECADLMRRAIARDPDLAFAHAYLALVLAIGHLVGLVSGEGWREEALTAAERAVMLDSQDSDVLGYVGCALADMGDHHRGIGMLRRAVELDPSNAQARAALGAALLQLGEEEGIEHMRQGMGISPRDNRLAAWGALLARGLLNFGRVTEAIEVADKSCRCDDKIFLPRVVLAIARSTIGDQKGARAALDDARRIRPRLGIPDIARFALPAEIAGLERAGLL
ncbi:MAG: winged helix-turn-helix domain-containing protein [Chromatiaceae bacterium]|nr:winged helix-turn-helix domain-containing protein [Chromatiaceae bacterium]